VIVEADRVLVGDTPFARSGFVGIVNLDHRRNRVEDLASVLSQMAGVRVRQYGGLGSFATVSIRGASSSQVNIYLDGVPLNDPYTGVANVADLPLGGMKQVEVYRGFAPPAFGSSAIGGAINLVSRDDVRRAGLVSRAELRSSYGSYETVRHQASVWSGASWLKLFAFGGYTSSQGDFTFLDNEGTPQNLNDDVIATRVNNAYEGWSLLARARLLVRGFGPVSLTYDGLDREQGVPGLGIYQSETATSHRRRHMTHLNVEPTPFFDNRLRASLVGFYSSTNERFLDPDASVSFTPQDTDNVITGQGGRARGKWFSTHLPIAVEAVYERRKERYHPVTNLPARKEGPDRLREVQTTAVTGDAYVFGQKLILSATQRWESYANEFYGDPP
jgi:iron complex outermembrane receptor protein